MLLCVSSGIVNSLSDTIRRGCSTAGAGQEGALENSESVSGDNQLGHVSYMPYMPYMQVD